MSCDVGEVMERLENEQSSIIGGMLIRHSGSVSRESL